jgi:hypothetical protein
MADLENFTENMLNEALPTIYKAKLSRFLSYPLGAQKISEALVGLAEFASIGLDFFNNSERNHGTQRPYQVLQASYRKMPVHLSSGNTLTEKHWRDANWTVTVSAVPRIVKHEIQVLLTNEALPRLRDWFLMNRNSFGREGRASITVLFDEGAKALSFEESSSAEWHTARSSRSTR